MHVHSGSSSLRGYRITTPWWIPKWELFPTCSAERAVCRAEVVSPWVAEKGYGIPPGSSPFPLTGLLVVVLWYWTSSIPKKRKRKRMVSMGLFVFPSYIFGLLSWSQNRKWGLPIGNRRESNILQHLSFSRGDWSHLVVLWTIFTFINIHVLHDIKYKVLDPWHITQYQYLWWRSTRGSPSRVFN